MSLKRKAFVMFSSVLKNFLKHSVFLLIGFSGFAYSAERYEPVEFNIAAQALDAALVSFSAQAGIQLSMRGGTAGDKTVKRLKGRYTPDEALKILLNDSGFAYEFSSDNAVVVKPLKIANEKDTNSSSSKTADDDANDDEYGALRLEEMIVTGTTSRNQTKLESSVSITTLGTQEMDREAPLGLADLLEVVPGFWVEDSGGETNNNVAPRGLRGGEGFRYIGVEEDGLPVVYDGIWVDFFQRQDITIERMQAVRGGTSGILTTNGPAALVNFITRKPMPDPETIVKFAVTDYGSVRTDIYHTDALTDNWNYSVGGFYRQSDGVRDTGFTTDQGGQIRFTLARDFDDGSISFDYKHLDDKTTFYVPIPLTNQDDPSSIPGVDALEGTLLGPSQKSIAYLKADGSSVVRDLEDDAQHTQLDAFTMKFEKDLGSGWRMNEAARYSSFDNKMYILLNFDNSTLVQASQRLQAADVQGMLTTLAGSGAVSAGYRIVDTGELVQDPDSLNGNGLVTTSYPLYSESKSDQFINKLSFTNETADNSFTVGWLYAYRDADTLPVDQWEAQLLTDVRSNARRLDIVALDAGNNVVGQLTDDGALTYAPGWGQATARGEVKSHSLFVNNEHQFTDKLRVDLGLRIETLQLTSTASGTNFAVPVVGNGLDNNLANDASDMPSDVFFTRKETFSDLAWTVGFNYLATDDIAVFGRYADAFEMPRLMSHGQAIHSGAAANFADAVNLTFTEFGARYSGETFGMSATLFRTVFNDLTERNFTSLDGTIENQVIDTITTGVEFEAVWTPVNEFSLNLTGVYQDPTMEGFDGSFSQWEGKQVRRTPKLQLRLTPVVDFSWGDIFLTLHHLGDRYSDGENRFELPAYTTLDAGVNYYISDAIQLGFKGTNLTEEIGLTEGNPRSISGSQAGFDYYYARPILGRTFTANMTMKF